MKENSIEEYIKSLEDFSNESVLYGSTVGMTLEKYKDLQLSTEHILSDYKRVLKENNELKHAIGKQSIMIAETLKNNEDLRKKINEEKKIIESLEKGIEHEGKVIEETRKTVNGIRLLNLLKGSEK